MNPKYNVGDLTPGDGFLIIAINNNSHGYGLAYCVLLPWGNVANVLVSVIDSLPKGGQYVKSCEI